jgi:hypothetical protein
MINMIYAKAYHTLIFFVSYLSKTTLICLPPEKKNTLVYMISLNVYI